MIKKVVTLIVIVLAIVFFIINAIMNTSEIGNIREMKVVELSKTTTDVLKNKRFVLFMDNSGSMKGYMDFASTANPEEFKEAKKEGCKAHMEEELGDILFAVVNLARWNKIDAEQALLKSNKKFMTRFRKMEELAVKPLNEYSFEEFDALWKQAKKSV